MSRIISRILFSALFALSISSRAIGACEPLLMTSEARGPVVRETLDEVQAGTKLFKRLVFKAMDRSLTARALKTCEARGYCTREDVARGVRESIDSLAKDVKLARGYAIILGAWAGGLSFATYLNTVPMAQVYAPLTALLTGAGLSWVSAPIVDRISSKVRRWVYALLGVDNSPGVKHPEDSELETFYLETQATIGPLAQIGGQRLNQLLDSLDKKVSDARVSLRSGDPKLAIDQLAEIVVRMREFFPDVRPDHKAVARIVRTSLLAHVPHEGLRSGLLVRIRELDPVGASGNAALYYDRVLEAWFGGSSG